MSGPGPSQHIASSRDLSRFMSKADMAIVAQRHQVYGEHGPDLLWSYAAPMLRPQTRPRSSKSALGPSVAPRPCMFTVKHES
jgi:hypothetical protein